MRAPKDYLRTDIRLADFGEAQSSAGNKIEIVQPNGLRAPEVVLCTGWGSKADVWNLGLIVSNFLLACFSFVAGMAYAAVYLKIWEIFEFRMVFNGVVRSGHGYTTEGQLCEMVHYLGPPPAEFVSRSPFGMKYFDKGGLWSTNLMRGFLCIIDGCIGNVKGLPPPTWKSIWEMEENLEGQEQELFLDFIRSMLRWLPEERPSAEELLNHQWLVTDDE